MEQIMVTVQGRQICLDLALIERLLAENPGWGRSRLSVALCEVWGWRSPNGQLKDIACRNLLLRLERAGHIVLPPRQRKSPNAFRNRSRARIPHSNEPIEGDLGALLPLQVSSVAIPWPGISAAGCAMTPEQAQAIYVQIHDCDRTVS